MAMATAKVVCRCDHQIAIDKVPIKTQLWCFGTKGQVYFSSENQQETSLQVVFQWLVTKFFDSKRHVMFGSIFVPFGAKVLCQYRMHDCAPEYINMVSDAKALCLETSLLHSVKSNFFLRYLVIKNKKLISISGYDSHDVNVICHEEQYTYLHPRWRVWYQSALSLEIGGL